jgi:hypothetical protein
MRRLAVVAVLFGLLAVARPAAAEGEPAVVAVGWWTQDPAASAPDGGFAVGAGPGGALTVAAVRVDIGADGVLDARLVAPEAGGLPPELAFIRVCVAADSWSPAAGGSLNEAPAAECASGETGFERDPGNGVWSADVTSLLAGRSGVVSLTLIPASAGVDPLPPVAFELGFGPPSTTGTARTAATGSAEPPPPEEAPTPLPALEPLPPPLLDLDIAAAPLPSTPAVGPAPTVPTASPAPVVPAPTPLVRHAADNGPRSWRIAQGALFVLVSAAAGVLAGAGHRFRRRFV